MRIMMRTMLLAATAMAPAAALAQTAAPAAEATADDQGATVNDIIVTARKFSERLQNAPTSVAVTTAATIDNLNLNSVADIAKTTPGLILNDGFGRNGSDRPVIRGQANILGFSGVAYFIDGIYYSGSLSDYDVDSIERVEVVKGPQSALYGRNTYSGAINIISKAPTDHWQGRIQGNVGERNYYIVNGTIRGPLGNGFGLIASGRYYRNGGDYKNAFDGSRLGKQETASGLAMITYDNGGPIRGSLRANYNKTDDGQPAIYGTSTNSNNCFFDRGSYYNGDGRYYCGTIKPGQPTSDYSRRFVDPSYAGTHIRTLNAALKLEADIAPQVTLTSLTGYNSRKYDNQTDGDYTGLAFQQPIYYNFPCGPGTYCLGNNGAAIDFTNSTHEYTRDVSEELRLRYDSSRLKVLVGGYYFRQTDHNYDNRVLPANALALAQSAIAIQAADICAHITGCTNTVLLTPISITAPDRNTAFYTTRNMAVFGSIDFKFTDTLSISAEGRYADEKIEQATQTYNLGQTAPAPSVVSASFKRFTPRITLSWQATPNHLFYGIYSEGEKPGGFNGNIAIVAGFPTYDPERVRSFEVGTKNTFLDGALVVNLALFRNMVRGYQLTGTVSVPPNQVSVTRNAGNVRIQGGELGIVARPDRYLTVTANYALAHSRFTSGSDEVLGLLNDIADDGLNNCSMGKQFAALACGSSNAAYGSIVGKQLPRSPEHSVFIDVDYRRPIGDSGWKWFAGANVNMLSSTYDQVSNYAKTGGSTVVDARLGFENDRFKIQAYVTNLTKENSAVELIRYAGPDFRRNFIAGLRPPRRFGVIGEARF